MKKKINDMLSLSVVTVLTPIDTIRQLQMIDLLPFSVHSNFSENSQM